MPANYFACVLPFEWFEQDGPMPVRVGAMVSNGVSAPDYNGQARIVGLSDGQGYSVQTVFGDGGFPLPGNLITFNAGAWEGKIQFSRQIPPPWWIDPSRPFIDVGCRAFDMTGAIAGGSNACRLKFLGAAPPQMVTWRVKQNGVILGSGFVQTQVGLTFEVNGRDVWSPGVFPFPGAGT